MKMQNMLRAKNKKVHLGGTLALCVALSLLAPSVGHAVEVKLTDGNFKLDDAGRITSPEHLALTYYSTIYILDSQNGNEFIVDGFTKTFSNGGSELNYEVYGGYADASSAASADVSKNHLTISNRSVVDRVYGGHVDENSKVESVNGNIVHISDSTIKSYVYGGNKFNRNVKGSANNNVVYIGTGSIVDGSVYGGSAYGDSSVADCNTVTFFSEVTGYVIGGWADDCSASNNTVNIHANALGIYGGDANRNDNNVVNWYSGTITEAISVGARGTGNVLNVYGNDLQAGAIRDFDVLNFIIPQETQAGAIIVIVGNEKYNASTNLNGKTINVGVMAGSGLRLHDKVILLDNAKGITVDDAKFGKLKDSEDKVKGLSIDYMFDTKLNEDGNKLITTISEYSETSKPNPDQLHPESKSLVETQVLSVANVNSSLDMMLGKGMEAASLAAAGATSEGQAVAGAGGATGETSEASNVAQGFAPFAYAGTDKMKYKTGSHIDANGYNVGVGFAREVANNAGKLVFGPVVHYGRASYDSYLDNGFHGEGKATEIGLSLVAKQVNKDGLYYEGSLGGGRVTSDYQNSQLGSFYDTKANYYAAHLGVGKVHKLSEQASVEYYAKMLYTHQNASNATVHDVILEDYRFDAVDSVRTRLGARVENEYNALGSYYYGLAWEYEFAGDARATYTALGKSTPSPSLKGSSGMAEIGWKVKPSAGSKLSADLGLQGWFGKKQGVGVNAMLNWNFS